MLQKQRSIKVNKTDDKEHLALVVNNVDPLKLERLQVRVSEIHRGVPDANLPWAVRTDKQSPSGDNGQVGSIGIPAIGSQVTVEFQDDSPYHLFWSGGIANGFTEVPELTLTNYPNSYGYVDNSGNKWFVNTTVGINSVTFTHITGTTISIDNNGDVTLTSAANLNLQAVGNVQIAAGGTIQLGSTGAMTLSGSAVNIAGAGSWPLGKVLSANASVTAGSIGASGTVAPTVASLSFTFSVTPRTRPPAVNVANMVNL